MRLSVCAFYIRVEALYTLTHHPAESVTSDFFIADPITEMHANAYSFQNIPKSLVEVTEREDRDLDPEKKGPKQVE